MKRYDYIDQPSFLEVDDNYRRTGTPMSKRGLMAKVGWYHLFTLVTAMLAGALFYSQSLPVWFYLMTYLTLFVIYVGFAVILYTHKKRHVHLVSYAFPHGLLVGMTCGLFAKVPLGEFVVAAWIMGFTLTLVAAFLYRFRLFDWEWKGWVVTIMVAVPLAFFYLFLSFGPLFGIDVSLLEEAGWLGLFVWLTLLITLGMHLHDSYTLAERATMKMTDAGKESLYATLIVMNVIWFAEMLRGAFERILLEIL